MSTPPHHTPPPWTITQGPQGALDIDSRHEHVAFLPMSPPWKRQRANARLMALAPRMLRFIQAGHSDAREAQAILNALTRLKIRRIT